MSVPKAEGSISPKLAKHLAHLTKTWTHTEKNRAHISAAGKAYRASKPGKKKHAAIVTKMNTDPAIKLRRRIGMSAHFERLAIERGDVAKASEHARKVTAAKAALAALKPKCSGKPEGCAACPFRDSCPLAKMVAGRKN